MRKDSTLFIAYRTKITSYLQVRSFLNFLVHMTPSWEAKVFFVTCICHKNHKSHIFTSQKNKDFLVIFTHMFYLQISNNYQYDDAQCSLECQKVDSFIMLEGIMKDHNNNKH